MCFFKFEVEVFHMDTSALNTPCTGRNEEEEASDTKNREARTSNGKILPAFFGSSFVTVCATKNGKFVTTIRFISRINLRQTVIHKFSQA